jgi:hypothetical protein
MTLAFGVSLDSADTTWDAMFQFVGTLSPRFGLIRLGSSFDRFWSA